MARIMFDSDVIADLPRNSMCATYADLIHDHAALDNLRAEFPHGLLFFDRHGDPLDIADILDVENGLHNPEDAKPWLLKRKTQGKTGTIYANRSIMPIVNALCKGMDFYRHIATLDGTMHIDGYEAGHTPAAIQFASAAMLGFHCDASIVWQDSWHPAPAIWQGSQTLLGGLQVIHTDLENCITIVKRHTSLANAESIAHAEVQGPQTS